MKMIQRNLPSKKKQAGLTLIELSIGIVIAAALIFGVFYLVGVVNDRSVVKDEGQYLNQMIADARTKFRQQGSYNGINPGVMINLGIVPPPMVNGANIRTGWSTNVAVAPTNLNGTVGDGISFTYTVPRKSCSDFVDAGAGAASRVTIGGTVVKSIPAGQNNLNIVNVATACDSDAAGNVAVIFEQGR